MNEFRMEFNLEGCVVHKLSMTAENLVHVVGGYPPDDAGGAVLSRHAFEAFARAFIALSDADLEVRS